MGDVVTALGRAVQEEGHDVSVVRLKPWFSTPPPYLLQSDASSLAGGPEPVLMHLLQSSSAATPLHQTPRELCSIQPHKC